MSKITLSSNVAGTGTLTIASPNTNTDQTLTLPDNTGTVVSTGSSAVVSQSMLASGVAGNGPAFSAWANTTGSAVSANTFTKFLFDTELWDTNNNYASSRFTPTVAGYYLINATIQYGTQFSGFATIYKNGAEEKRGAWASFAEASVSGVVYCNGTTDYIEIFGYQSVAGNIPQRGQAVCWCDGTLLRAA